MGGGRGGVATARVIDEGSDWRRHRLCVDLPLVVHLPLVREMTKNDEF